MRGFLILMMLIATHFSFAQKSKEEKADLPMAKTVSQARADQVLQNAVLAYRFFYPTVSMEGIIQGNLKVGAKINQTMFYLSASPLQTIFTGNSDTPYGGGMFDLSKSGPIVIDMPAGPYIGLINDHNQTWVTDLGIPGVDKGKGGKYLLLPHDYDKKIPEGYHVARAQTNLAFMALRVIPQEGNLEKAFEAMKQVKVYPYTNEKNPKPFAWVSGNNKPVDMTCLSWEDNIGYWQHLAKVVNEEVIPPSFAPMYGLLRPLGIEKGKQFNPTRETKELLERAAVMGKVQMMASGFASNRSDILAWNDRKWEWLGLVPESGSFVTKAGDMDLEARDRWYIQAIVSSPAMFRRTTDTGSLYWGGFRDRSGEMLDGSKTYKLNIPQPVPARLFWSVTVYDTQTRSQIQTLQKRAAIRSLFEKMVKNSDGSVDLYFGPKAPAGKEGQWIQTLPNKAWFAYTRIYGPEKGAFDGTWKPGDFEEVSNRSLSSIE